MHIYRIQYNYSVIWSNSILHSCSGIAEFVEVVWEQLIRCLATPCILSFFPWACSVNSEMHEHSCKNIYINNNGYMMFFLSILFQMYEQTTQWTYGLLILCCKNYIKNKTKQNTGCTFVFRHQRVNAGCTFCAQTSKGLAVQFCSDIKGPIVLRHQRANAGCTFCAQTSKRLAVQLCSDIKGPMQAVKLCSDINGPMLAVYLYSDIKGSTLAVHLY